MAVSDRPSKPFRIGTASAAIVAAAGLPSSATLLCTSQCTDAPTAISGVFFGHLPIRSFKPQIITCSPTASGAAQYERQRGAGWLVRWPAPRFASLRGKVIFQIDPRGSTAALAHSGWRRMWARKFAPPGVAFPAKGCRTLGAPFAVAGCCAHVRRHRAYLGDGSGLSGVVGVIGFDGSGPLDSEEAGPPGVVAGTFP
jgi:hypothetical protein